jgi:hypothetical protein
VAGGTAFVVSLDASGVAGAPLALGPALASGRVAVAFTAGRIGASYVGTTGDAMAAVVVDGLARTLAVGPGAMSRGHVSIARASDGFFVTWSSSGDAIEGVFVDLDGVASGARYAHDTAWNDDAHAALGLAEGWLLATDTMPGASPVHVALVGCP